MSTGNGEPDCLIVGASARAAASSAVASGLRVITADLFDDRDTQSLAEHSFKVDDYPNGLLAIRSEYRTLPVVYTGALENYPRLLTEFEDAGPLWGNPASVVERVRDPFELARAFQERKLSLPRVALQLGTDDRESDWLLKPRRSAGGQQVRRATDSDSTADRDSYFQEFIPGEVSSGSFVACGGTARLLGVSEMLVGEAWLGATMFTYCGSITRDPTLWEREQWERIGQCLAAEFGLLGLFGVDAVVRKQQVLPIEVNPRYASSMELLDRAGSPVFGSHVGACADQELIDIKGHGHSANDTACFGKAIVFAREAHLVPTALPKLGNEDTVVADIPQIGEEVSVGQPVLSLVTSGQSSANVLTQLKEAADEIYDWLAKTASPTAP